MKRLFDIIFSSIGLLFLFPLFVFVAILIKFDSPGPVFFRHERMGRNFQAFWIYKFRSMTADAPTAGPSVTVGGDARITKVGRFLRRTKIDELPQLINVVTGDMSLVGPRPEVSRYVELFRDDYERILSVRPGITDYAAIEFRNEEEVMAQYSDLEEGYTKDVLPHKIKLYNRYLADAGLLTDLKIIFLTLAKLFK